MCDERGARPVPDLLDSERWKGIRDVIERTDALDLSEEEVVRAISEAEARDAS